MERKHVSRSLAARGRGRRGTRALAATAAFCSVVALALGSGVAAAPIGGEPPDLPNTGAGTTFTAAEGGNSVSGNIGPTPDDIQDRFNVVIPSGLELTSIAYSGAAGPDFPHNVVGCGLIGGSDLAVEFDTPPTNCTLSYILSSNFAASPVPWIASITTQAAEPTPDTTPPVIAPPPDVTVAAETAAGAVVHYTTPTATDNVDSDVQVACTPPSGTLFAFGDTTVDCTATDDAANSASASFTVSVVDTVAPMLTVNYPGSVEATGPAGAVVDFTANASDNIDPDPTVTCDPPPGATFALGSTSVDCVAADDAGNETSDSFTVTVEDTTAPTLALPPDMFVPATGPSGASVDYLVDASDAVDPDPDVVCDSPSGTTFPLGATTVTCTVTDEHDNVASGSFTVTVQDEEFPVLELPADISVEAAGPDGAVVTYRVTATDLVDPNPDVSCTEASGTTFPVGPSLVTCTATDDDGNETVGTFLVTVTDTVAPVLDLPGDITVAAGGPDGAIVTFEAAATDSVRGAVPVVCEPPSGSRFPVGTTTVTCSATDAMPPGAGFYGRGRPLPPAVDAGNVATGTFTVTVEGVAAPTTTSAPTLAPPSTTVAASELPATR